MKEFIYIPRREADVSSAFESLAQATSGTNQIVMTTALSGNTSISTNEARFEAATGSVRASASMASAGAMQIEMIDYVEQSGAVLLRAAEMPESDESQPGSFHPVLMYTPAIAKVRVGRTNLKINSGPSAADFLSIKLRYSDDATPVEGAVVNLQRKGLPELNAVSDQNGIVTFGVRAPQVSGARLLAEPGFAGNWGLLKSNIDFTSGTTFEVERVNLAHQTDSLRYMLGSGNPHDGDGVKVGIIDTGVGPHRDLSNASGDRDSSIGHGTHVAGIVAGRGTNGLAGVAPGAELLSYRVFNDPATGVARNFEIHRAIEQAVDDGCHIINLSLKLESDTFPQRNDGVVSRALEDAADAGVLCVAAAGNDFRRFVAFPARHRDVVAVSALGWEYGFGRDAYDKWTITSDVSTTNSELFFAKFSNEGTNGTGVDLIGPGAGVISTVPGDTYAPMSGTSMSCPAMVGAISRILSTNQGVLAMPQDRNRTTAILQLIQSNLIDAGFNMVKQGDGTLN